MNNKPNPQQKQNRKETIANLIKFIEKEFPNFKPLTDFAHILAHKKGEDQHSQAFCVFINEKAQGKYNFVREVSQKGSAKVDFGVYKARVLIFTIEAKVLPTPKGTKKSPRDIHEYVYRNIGSGAGIERFKKNMHGLDDWENPSIQNGMIAYVKKESFEYWFDKINAWILEAGWCVEEILQPKYDNQIDTHISKHTRIDNSTLTLHHFWVYAN